jgi:hypothetical protein
LDSDSNPDVVVIARDAASALHAGDGAGHLAKPVRLNVPVSHPEGLSSTADFNRDGLPDLVVHDDVQGNSAVFINDDLLHFAAPNIINYAWAFGDFNGDGWKDIISNDGLLLNKMTATGTFGTPTALSPRSLLPTFTKAIAGDFNGDGKLDLLVGSGNISLDLKIALNTCL